MQKTNNLGINSVIFDMAGVLVADGYEVILNYASELYDVDKSEMNEFLAPLVLEQLDQGAVTYWEAVEKFERGYGRVRRARKIPKSIFNPKRARDFFNEPFYQLGIERVRLKENAELANNLISRGVKVGVLSNITESILNFYLDTGFFRNFNPVYLTFSCKEHCKKPDHGIYRTALSRLESTPEETLYIDDNERYVEAANNLGIVSLQYMHGRNDLESMLREFGVNL